MGRSGARSPSLSGNRHRQDLMFSCFAGGSKLLNQRERVVSPATV
jgi:hypothetical protein